MGCDATSEFKIATLENPGTQVFYALEESSFCIRLFCKASRPLTMTVYEGENKEGKPVMKLDRPFRMAMGNCKCCCYQEIFALDAEGGKVGGVKEQMYMCPVPRFDIYDNTGNKFFISQPTCCGGFCVNCMAKGCCNCKIPFYIFAPGQDPTKHEEAKGEIVKEWGGLATEMLTSADKFSVKFPEGASDAEKAGLFAAVMMIGTCACACVTSLQ